MPPRHMQHQQHRQHHVGDIEPRYRGPGRSDEPRHEKTITGLRRPWNASYKVADVVGMAGEATSNPYPVYWPVSGIIREISGTVISSDETIIASGSPAAMSLVQMTITIMDGRTDILKQAAAAGNAGAGFISFASLFGLNGDRIYILERVVKNAYAYQVRFQTLFSSDLDVELTPELVFHVDEDPHGVHRSAGLVEVPMGTEIEVYGGGQKHRIDTSR